MTDDIWRQLARTYTAAAQRAPGLNARFRKSGFDPAAISGPDDLNRLPVMKKEELLELQRDNPPFGGFLAADSGSVSHIFVSPGPIFEPSLPGRDGHGLAILFEEAGLGPGDILLNTWSYHLVPAGLLFDQAAQAVGATVIPGGVGNRELQAQVIVEAGVTAICASTAFFVALSDTVIGTFGRDSWKVKTAFLGGEPGDWMAKRRRIEKEYGVTTWAAYATADLGLIGFEDGGDGYRVHPERIVQICDPENGAPLPKGETGEIVVTNRNALWPMIRFGTGDSAYALDMTDDGLVTRLSPIQGRVGAAVKVREIFLYPRAIEEIVIACPTIARAQAIATREGGRDFVRLRIMAEQGADRKEAEAAARETFQKRARIRADIVEFVERLDEDAPLLVNLKDS